jgi:glycosyltransferase involved in cell wall biosynthesis
MNVLRDRELVGIAKTKNLKILCQSNYQLGELTKRLNEFSLSADLKHVSPFFNIDSRGGRLRFSNKSLDTLNVLRIGRDDEPFKYPRDMWDLFYKVTAPVGVTTRLNVIGWGREGEALLGDVGNASHPYHGRINAELIPHIHTPAILGNYFRDAHALLMWYPVRENAPRVLFEAIASGAVVVGASHGGIPEFVRDQETGFLVSSNDEASRRLSQLAFNPSKATRMAEQAYDNLKKGIGCPKCAFTRFSAEFR